MSARDVIVQLPITSSSSRPVSGSKIVATIGTSGSRWRTSSAARNGQASSGRPPPLRRRPRRARRAAPRASDPRAAPPRLPPRAAPPRSPRSGRLRQAVGPAAEASPGSVPARRKHASPRGAGCARIAPRAKRACPPPPSSVSLQTTGERDALASARYRNARSAAVSSTELASRQVRSRSQRGGRRLRARPPLRALDMQVVCLPIVRTCGRCLQGPGGSDTRRTIRRRARRARMGRHLFELCSAASRRSISSRLIAAGDLPASRACWRTQALIHVAQRGPRTSSTTSNTEPLDSAWPDRWLARGRIGGDDDEDQSRRASSSTTRPGRFSFYTDVLGFVKKYDIPLGEHRWLTVVSPEDPGRRRAAARARLAIPPPSPSRRRSSPTASRSRRSRVDDVHARVRAPHGPGRRVHPGADGEWAR